MGIEGDVKIEVGPECRPLRGSEAGLLDLLVMSQGRPHASFPCVRGVSARLLGAARRGQRSRGEILLPGALALRAGAEPCDRVRQHAQLERIENRERSIPCRRRNRPDNPWRP